MTSPSHNGPPFLCYLGKCQSQTLFSTRPPIARPRALKQITDRSSSSLGAAKVGAAEIKSAHPCRRSQAISDFSYWLFDRSLKRLLGVESGSTKSQHSLKRSSSNKGPPSHPFQPCPATHLQEALASCNVQRLHHNLSKLTSSKQGGMSEPSKF